jgi:NADPH-dependent 2,4-dienoyl-CoA reductase/sulfur reductase-like enzyme
VGDLVGRVVVLIDDHVALPEARPLYDFPVIHVGAWPADLSLRREDLYGDEGR